MGKEKNFQIFQREEFKSKKLIHNRTKCLIKHKKGFQLLKIFN